MSDFGLVNNKGYTRENAYNSVGKGWHKLLDPIFDYIEAHSDVIVVQVKEKYGTLRVYADPMYTDIDDPAQHESAFASLLKIEEIIDHAEHLSETTCETCGNPGHVMDFYGWYRAVCPACE